MRHAAVRKAMQVAERELGASGRVLLRASGTEPVIRVMVEGKTRAPVKRWAEAIAGAVRTAADANSA
ncbi:Phosphoglucosamine mutase [compost metagenome]